MVSALAAYLPQDRRRALAQGLDLPKQTTGTALFADISGFTPLTEALDRALGARRGAEELTHQINRLYDSLIAEVDRYGGSVIGFASDAITCWFDDGNGVAAERAVTCAVALQSAMRQFVALPLPDGSTAALALKVALASGATRRLVVGNPSIQLLDVLAGAPLARTAAGEHLAAKGEVLIDEATAVALGGQIQIAVWRMEKETSERFAVVSTNDERPWMTRPITLLPTHRLTLSAEQLRPWLLPAVYDRHQAGLGDFLTELRPAVALFLRFAGIDYDGDPEARSQLDTFIRRVQGILARYDGALLQLTIGDKGSYLSAAFGVPTSHEDDGRRAARAALEWLALSDQLDFLQPLQIGISRGVLRAGAYGGTTRQTYGVLGDEVNLAARLMQRAAPGEILISGRVQAALAAEFVLEPLEPIPLKGMPEPLPVFRLAGARQQAVRLTEPAYALPMVGRASELALIGEKLDRALGGQGQVVGIIAEAGMGKSRLVAEVIHLARRKGLRGFGGACQSYGTNSPYLVWEAVWRAFFDLDPATPIRRQIRALEGVIGDWTPERMEALPLLGPLLGLLLAENEFTKSLEPQHRRSALEALLLDCLTASAREAQEDRSGLLLVLEDLHWIDALSHDLLERVAQAVIDLPVLIVLAYRPPELLRLQTPRIEALEHFTRLALGPLTDAEAAQVIRAKLAQLLPERKGATTPTLVARIMEKAQGNPFYVEELLNYLRDRGIDPQDTRAIEALDLPASLHTLILSRIDQLSAQQQAELKVASVIGRLFRVAHLHGAYPMLGDVEPLKTDLEELASLELTPLDTPEPELAYLFKHIVTQEVAYESLTVQARANLHEQLAAYLEQLAGDDAERYLDLLAYHYDRSDNLAKKRYYLRQAGEVAKARYANDAALDYLSRALALAPEVDTIQRYGLLLTRENVYNRSGNRQAQQSDLTALARLAETLDDDGRRAEVAARQADYAQRTGNYAGALAAAERAVGLAQAALATATVVAAYYQWAMTLYKQGNNDAASVQATAALDLARMHGDRKGEGAALKVLGNVALEQRDYARARDYYEQGLRIVRATGDRQSEGWLLGNLGNVALEQRDYARARDYYEQGLRIVRAIGDRQSEGWALGSLGSVALEQRDYATAQDYCAQSLRLTRETGDRREEGQALLWLSRVARSQGDYARARDYCVQSLSIFREIGYRPIESIALSNLGLIAHQQGDDIAAESLGQQALTIAQEIGEHMWEANPLTIRGHALLGLGRPVEAAAAYQAALDIQRSLSQPNVSTEPQAGLARVALAQGDYRAALARTQPILAHLDEGGALDGTDEPLRIYLTCYQVLHAAGDPRAAGILEAAHATLQEQAAKITDDAMRRMFLENVPCHREIVAAWAAHT